MDVVLAVKKFNISLKMIDLLIFMKQKELLKKFYKRNLFKTSNICFYFYLLKRFCK